MKTKITLLAVGAALFLAACDSGPDSDASKKSEVPTPPPPVVLSLDEILAAQSEENKARYAARRPKETLEFLGIKPGMSVVEVLPGGGWYSKILLPYLGDRGHLIGVDYSADMYPKFGFFNEEQLKAKRSWVQTWTDEALVWRGPHGPRVSAFQLGRMPGALKQKADAALLIRALHNLARFESDGGYLTAALNDLNDVLRPGGIVGIVQHMAPEEASDEWANGANGYLKKSFVIARMKEAGFELVDSSDINVNSADQPTEEDFVWRLPPSFANSKEDAELKKKYEAIGESTRMTLKFKKSLEPPR